MLSELHSHNLSSGRDKNNMILCKKYAGCSATASIVTMSLNCYAGSLAIALVACYLQSLGSRDTD